MHRALIQGEVRYVKYFLERHVTIYRAEYYIAKKTELFEYRTIWDGELNSQMLNKGDTVYIPRLDKRVVISKRIIDIDNGVVTYETDNIAEIVENDATKESLVDTELLLKRHKESARVSLERVLEMEARSE